MSGDRYIHVLHLPLVFPAGLSAGQGRDGSRMILARDGRGRPVLRGTSLAGVLRHAYAAMKGASSGDESVARWFGRSPEEGQTPNPSPLRVSDTLLNVGQAGSLWRQHNAINRHRGAVDDGALFSLESLPPGTTADVRLVLDTSGTPLSQVQAFIAELAGLIQAGLWMGGSAARGVGLGRLRTGIACRRYDLNDSQQLAAWLDDDDAWRASRSLPRDGVTLEPGSLATRTLQIDCTLSVPRGQDMLVGDGLGLEDDREPQQVVAADGKAYWRLPGSALRGPFRDWFSRLAARELGARAVADSAAAYAEDIENDMPTSHAERVGWCRAAGEARERLKGQSDQLTCPVARLFGSLYARGRLRILDGLSSQPINPRRDTQRRCHVAVDRFSGGANEGALFSDSVLTPGVQFATQIHLTCTDNQADTERELRWLARTLHALHVGLIRIGASDSAGRLEVEIKNAQGAAAEAFLAHCEQLGLLKKELNHG